MKTVQNLYQERINRILKAVNLEKPDRVPIVFNGEPFCGRIKDVKLSEFCFNPMYACEKAFEGFKSLRDIDSVEQIGQYPPILGSFFLSDMKLPGRELKENDIWQIDEKGIMTVKDYDTIIDKGWNYFLNDCFINRLNADVYDDLKKAGEYSSKVLKMYADAGVVHFGSSFGVQVPLDSFFPGRLINNMIKDLFRMPDKVEAAMKVAMIDIVAVLREQIRTTKPIAVFLGGARVSSAFTSKKIFNRFVMPYLEELLQVIVDEGSLALLHFDGDWNNDFEHLRKLPKAKCVLALDGGSDIYKAKEILGDHMCIMGDVPPGLLTLGTPDEVYNYCTKLINEIGPSGFMLAAGCVVPVNAKVENVKAMICAATGK
ncbi:uroporphyrinogen decarboxylase family protein [Clostridium thailandense]|uniref:uroporphyrinogen decarboxylase family protein n=1 Tax=Clostridium thailandense TaxID=2794346 RepID=UPI0039892CEC